MTTIQQLKETTRLCREQFGQTEAATLLNTCRKGASLTGEQRRQIMESIHRSFADVDSCLRASHPALGSEDIDLCLLSAVQCPSYAIADCLSVSEEAIRVRRHRLKGKLPQEVRSVFWEERKATSLLMTLFMKDTMQNVWRRFPVAVIFLTLLTAFCLWLSWTTIPAGSPATFL